MKEGTEKESTEGPERGKDEGEWSCAVEMTVRAKNWRGRSEDAGQVSHEVRECREFSFGSLVLLLAVSRFICRIEITSRTVISGLRHLRWPRQTVRASPVSPFFHRSADQQLHSLPRWPQWVRFSLTGSWSGLVSPQLP